MALFSNMKINVRAVEMDIKLKIHPKIKEIFKKGWLLPSTSMVDRAIKSPAQGAKAKEDKLILVSILSRINWLIFFQILETANLNNSNSLATSSNSNLFIFKNGWTSSQQVDKIVSHSKNPSANGGQAVSHFKYRPQSSNHHGYRKKGAPGVGLTDANKIWQYNKYGSKNDLVAGITTLKHTNSGIGYKGHIVSAPSSGLNRTNS